MAVRAAAFLLGGLLATGAAPAQTSPAAQRVKLAVLGDSDSHAYHDPLGLPTGAQARGGAFHATTWQWTELLQRWRADQIDLGEWGAYGWPLLAARGWSLVGGGPVRARVKQDFQYNFAISGSVCGQLSSSRRPQATLLAQLIDADPQGWRSGVVVIRHGINNLGVRPSLDLFARAPDADASRELLDACVDDTRRAVRLLRAHSRDLHIVVVGIFDNTEWARYHAYWHSPQELANIRRVLDRHDQAMRDLVRDDPRAAFFDDRAWFAQRWGTRNERGEPDYRAVTLGGTCRVVNAIGDSPENATIADGHAGTAWNALWSQALVNLLRERFALPLRPISDQEVLGVLRGTPACHQG